jgi:hypothetical protein
MYSSSLKDNKCSSGIDLGDRFSSLVEEEDDRGS